MTEQSAIVTFSDTAIKKITEIVKLEENVESKVLRLAVVGGGCSGLSYKMEFDAPKENDNIIDLSVIKVGIDPKSSIYLKDTHLDFEDGLEGKGFIFKNPNAENTCGCGESFTI